jgi:uncharacterized protein YegL
MRRLPIYFLIDVSESMVGEQINSVEEGIYQVIKELRTDPYALETVFISIVVFAGKAKTLIPLTDILTFYPPKFSVGGGTSLGDGLGQLMFEMRKNYVPTTVDIKGDWKPIVFLFSDGGPTDNPSTAINEWRKNWSSKCSLIAISLGDEISVNKLKELTTAFLFLFLATVQALIGALLQTFLPWVRLGIK